MLRIFKNTNNFIVCFNNIQQTEMNLFKIFLLLRQQKIGFSIQIEKKIKNIWHIDVRIQFSIFRYNCLV